MKRRHAILLLGGASSGAMSVGSGAFSSVNAERGIDVTVVEDENAYLGLQQVKETVPVDNNRVSVESAEYDPNDVVKIQNQFSNRLNLTVTVQSTGGIVDEDSIEIDGESANDDKSPNEIEVGHEVFIGINCDRSGEGWVELYFDGEAGGSTVEMTRSFDVSCLDVEFNGANANTNANANANTNNGGGTVHISGFSDTDALDVKVNGESAGTIPSDANEPYVITPNEGRIYSVTVDGIKYVRADRNDPNGDA